MIYDLIIIGMGPAGMSAGIYAKRNGLNVLILEKGAPGGLVNVTCEVDNYLGFSNVMGPELVEHFYKHVLNVGVSFENKEVIDIKDNTSTKVVICKDTEYECKKIIIAIGRSPRRLGLANEEKLIGKGISSCALCDGNFYKDKDVAVLGAGNSALEEALHLATLCKTVYLISKSDSLKADKSLQERINGKNNIEIIYNSSVEKINEENGFLKSLTLKGNQELNVSGFFVYVGYEPRVNFKSIDLEKNNAGYLMVNENYETNISGIYAVGDIINKKYYQIITAVSEGAVAAINASKKMY